jgi:hypothetical protein
MIDVRYDGDVANFHSLEVSPVTALPTSSCQESKKVAA